VVAETILAEPLPRWLSGANVVGKSVSRFRVIAASVHSIGSALSTEQSDCPHQ